jgi:tripartite ATP-independent transporter DctM subunit
MNGEHMRLSAIVEKLPARARLPVEAVALVAPMLFLLIVIGPAYGYASEEIDVSTSALNISSAWRAASIDAGLILMAIASLFRLRHLDWRSLLIALGGIGLIAVCFWSQQSVFAALGNLNLLIFFGALVTLTVLAGVPIAFSFGIGTVSYLLLGTSMPLEVVVNRMDESMSNMVLLSVPLFVFLGLLIEMTGMAKSMIDFLASLVGHLRGGLSYVLLAGIYIVSGISGAKAADMAAIAPVLLPEMKKRGESLDDAVALMAASGAMSETSPPSLVLITIGSVTGVSIAALFSAGLLPGFVLALGLAVLARFKAPHLATQTRKRPSLKTIAQCFIIALPALILPVIIRTAVVEGIATATEVSTVGIVYSMICGLLFYRQFPLRRIFPMLIQTAALTGAIMLIIGCATCMAWALTQSGFSTQLAHLMSLVPGGKLGFMLVSIGLFIILGSVLEGIPALVLFGPLLFPIARMVGINDVHYAIVVILAMGLGLFAPPLGVGFYTACAIGKASPAHVAKKIWPYLLVLAGGVLLVAVFPVLSIGHL